MQLPYRDKTGYTLLLPSALLSSRFPRGATLDIVCLQHLVDLEGRGSNNVKSGTSAAREPFLKALPGGVRWTFLIPNS